MRTPEQKLWDNQLKPALDSIPGLVHERIELRTGAAGMPDVVYTYGGTGFIEMKVSDHPADISLLKWTSAQRSWAKRHNMAGGKVWLIIKFTDGVVLVNTEKVIDSLAISIDHEGIAAHWKKGKIIDKKELMLILWRGGARSS